MTREEVQLFYKTLGREVRKARERAKLTQEALGTSIGLSRTSVTNLEKGRQHIPVHLLFAIGRAVDRDPGTLMPSPEDVDLLQSLGASKQSDPELRRWLTTILKPGEIR